MRQTLRPKPAYDSRSADVLRVAGLDGDPRVCGAEEDDTKI